MKTPRDILLARHQNAQSKLDAVRQTVVEAELRGKETTRRGVGALVAHAWMRALAKLWLELVLPSRRVWSGLAATWIVIVALNVAQRDAVSSVTGRPVSGPAMAVNWQAQQRWMSELLAERVMPPDADRPRHDVPRPQTKAKLPTIV